MSISDTIASLLDNIPEKDCVKYNPETGKMLLLFDVQYRTGGVWRDFHIWAESKEDAELDVVEMVCTMWVHGQVLTRKARSA